MSTRSLEIYIPIDRRAALEHETDLPDTASGAVLFADISGFTPMTEALIRAYGARRGAEELTRQLNLVYDTLISQIHRYHGSVIGFSGDAVTCWFDADDGLCATACSVAMQQAMRQFVDLTMPTGETMSLAMKTAVATGTARRFLVGDPAIQYIDVLAGATLDRMATAEQLAQKGEVVLAPETAAHLSEQLAITEWRSSGDTGERFAVVRSLHTVVAARPWSPDTGKHLTDEQVRPWLLAPVYERLNSGQGEFLAEFRPVVPLFLRFDGIDYDHDPQAGAKLDAYIRWVQRTIAHYEGALVQVTVGDKGSYLYAAFGAPLTHDDDPTRAVAAALKLRAPPPELSYINRAQIGIARGQMRAGAYGGRTRSTYGVLGDDVNLAARLMSKTEPGQIMVSQRVVYTTSKQYQSHTLGPMMFKGKRYPVTVSLLQDRQQGMAAEKPGHPAADSTTLVGRKYELARFRAALERIQGRQGQVVIIEGEEGIGKSRLIIELQRLMAEQDIGMLRGSGQSIEQRTPYRAWRDILNVYFGLEAIFEPEARLTHVRQMVHAAAPHHAERLPLLNDVLHLDLPDTDLTAALDPALRQQNLTLLLIELLRARAEQQPLALVLEDAHWLDSLSWELTTQVMRALLTSDLPVLLLMATRPVDSQSLAHHQINLLRQLPATESLYLDKLADEEIIALVAARLSIPISALPDSVADLVLQRAGGNPFFAEELVLTLRDQGILVVETVVAEQPQSDTATWTRCRVVGDLHQATSSLPYTVEGLVLARIDNLSLHGQLVLKVGSVIGRNFSYRPLFNVIQRHTSIDHNDLMLHLESLSTLDLTPLDLANADDLVYHFKHIITREVAYELLLYAQRRDLHRDVAQWFEQSYPNGGSIHILAPYYTLLAHHYQRAEDPEKERLYSRLSGEQAAARFANAEAVAYLSRALELTPDNAYAERYAIVLAREQVYNLQGARELQAHDLDTLRMLAETLDDDQRRTDVALRQANYAEVTGNYPASIQAADNAIALAQKRNDRQREAAGYLQRGTTLLWQGNFADAHHHIEHAYQLAQAAQVFQVEADSLRTLGIVTHYQGDFARATLCLEQAQTLYSTLGDRLGESTALNSRGAVSAEQGDYAGARASFEHYLRISRELGDRRGESRALINLGVVSALSGNYADARDWLEQAHHLARALGDRWGEGWTLLNLGLVLHHLDENETAWNYSQQTLAIAQETGDRNTQGYALTFAGHALAAAGRLDEAADVYQQALDLRYATEQEKLALIPLAGLAAIDLARGQLDAALERVETILASPHTTQLAPTDEPLRVQLVCYRVLRARGDPRAAEVLAAAQGMLQSSAVRIKDQTMHRSFLENVRVHRDLLAETA